MIITSKICVSLQMILFDTPGIIEKKMHKLDSMMMKNVRSAGINADCVLIVVDACKAPEKVLPATRNFNLIVRNPVFADFFFSFQD